MVIFKKHQLIAAGAVTVALILSFWWRLSQLQTDLNFVKQISIPVSAGADQPPAVAPEPIIIKSDEDLTAALTGLQASLSALQVRLEALETSGPALSSPAPVAASSNQAVFQPQNIYLGSASTTSTDWVDTPAAVQLNAGDYPGDIHAVFEANLSIVGGEAWARLRNKTTGAILSVTEIFNNSATAAWKSSGNWQLHSANNNYVVQLKSSSGETVNLSSARIRLSR